MMIAEIIQGGGIKGVAEQMPEYPFPQYLLNGEQHTVWALKDTDGYCGVAYGHLAAGQTVFCFGDLYIKKERRTAQTTLDFYDAVFSAAASVLGATEIDWTYIRKAGETDPRPKIIERLPFYEKYCLEKRETKTAEWHCETAKFDRLRKNRWYKPHLAEQNGRKVIAWAKADGTLIEQIREKEAFLKQEPDYLSPFAFKGGRPIAADEKTSYLLTCGNEVLGWAITERLSDKAVKISRFYMYKSGRQPTAAVYFISYVLDSIAASYELLYFDVRGGNRSMEIAADKYFRAISDIRYICTLRLPIREK